MRRAVRASVIGISVLVAVAVIGRNKGPWAQRLPRELRAESKVAMVAMVAMSPAAAAAPAADTVASVESNDNGFLGFGRKLIRSAEMHVEVRDVALAARRADEIARVHAGFLAESHVAKGEHAPHDANFVVRVPADSFDVLVADLRQLGTVRTERLGTDDVTREYADLDTRLLVKEETATRLRTLLANRTGKLTDVLQVERELARVVTEIEQMKTQRHQYDRQVAMSSVSVTVFEPGESVLATLRASALDSVNHLGDVLLSSTVAVLSLVTFLIPWVTLAVLGWFGFRVIRRAY